jgi:hypothetical protein
VGGPRIDRTVYQTLGIDGDDIFPVDLIDGYEPGRVDADDICYRLPVAGQLDPAAPSTEIVVPGGESMKNPA